MSSVDDQPSPSSTAAATQPADRDATRTSSPSAAPSDPATASRLEPAPSSTERYEIISEHGRGGLGRVLRAHDRMLARDVAIKQMLAHGKVSELRFVREALITARLEHPNIVPVHEVGRWPDNTPFYAMKLIAGRPLRDLIAERSTVTERIGLLHHVIAVADAMAYAHERNIIHRDLKPANVIVGDFGETIVIDWGLAKELSSEEPTSTDGALHNNSVTDLTATGSVVGTPAYMAPEQERGRAVDQLADVFAIGAILWELCATTKVPPDNKRARHRLLQRSGIDPDLITILDKAIASDPKDRYPHAGALASDLKAFKTGTRIAARSYSLFGLLRHWVRRHRALAIASTCAIATALAGSLYYVHNITIERDRAETASNNLVLEHAELLLHSDPTSAAELLSQYRGRDISRHQLLLAEAHGLGIAKAILIPHQKEVRFILGNRAGEVLSVAEDRTIKLTRGPISMTLATNVSVGGVVAYSPSTHLLAYATTPPGVSLFDTETHQSTALSAIDPDQIIFASNGSRLAARTDSGLLIVWDVSGRPTVLMQRSFRGLQKTRFLGSDRIAVFDGAVISILSLDNPSAAMPRYSLAHVTSLESNDHLAFAGTTDGDIVVLSESLTHLVTFKACHTSVRQLQFLHEENHFAVACQEGGMEVISYDETAKKLAVLHKLSTQGITKISAQSSDLYIGLVDESGIPLIYNTQTQLTTRYLGIAGHPSFMGVPTPTSPDVLIGDTTGTIRIWEAPPSSARTVLHANSAMVGLNFTNDGRQLFAYGLEPTLYGINLSNSTVTELHGHSSSINEVFIAPDQRSMLSFGFDNTVRVWKLPDLTNQHAFTRHTGIVSKAAYFDDGKQIISSGDDGRLLLWTPDDDRVSILFSHTLPLVGFSIIRQTHHIIARDIHSVLWDISPHREVRLLRPSDGSIINVVRTSPDSTLFAIGTDVGAVTVYDTKTWEIVRFVTFTSGIRQINFDPHNRDLLIATEPQHLQSGELALIPLSGQREIAWRVLPLTARDAMYSPDGEIIGVVCAGGASWLYSVTANTWTYTQNHDTDVLTGEFASDGKRFATSDRGGNVVIHDLLQTFHYSSFQKIPNQQPQRVQ